MEKDKTNTKIEKLGNLTGFAVGLIIFVSILYYTLGKFYLIPKYFDYSFVITTTLSTYIFTLIFYELHSIEIIRAKFHFLVFLLEHRLPQAVNQ